MKTVALALMGACLGLPACSSAVWVKDNNANELSGIPFYSKKPMVVQTSTYACTWFKAVLGIEPQTDKKSGGAEAGAVSVERFFKAAELHQLDQVRRDIAMKKATGHSTLEIDLLYRTFERAGSPSSPTCQNAGDVTLLANTAKQEMVVDTTLRYINAPLPWFGKTEFVPELNEDGTLSKVSVKPESGLAEGISKLIPLNEFLSAKYVAPLTNSEETSKLFSIGPKARSGKVYNVTLQIAETGYLYNFVRRYAVYPETLTKIAFDPINGEYSRQPYVATPAKEEKKDDAKDAAGIKINGTITLPDGKPAGS